MAGAPRGIAGVAVLTVVPTACGGGGATGGKTLGQFARLQVERVRRAATGQNPDA